MPRASFVVDPSWTCRRDSSHSRRRSNGKGCYDCHLALTRRRRAKARARRRQQAARLAEEALLADPFDDVVITPAVREYLRTFDAFIAADRDGLASAIDVTAAARSDALRALTRHLPS